MYQKRGEIPRKRHIQFRKKSGGLYYEELFGTEGFSGESSLIYHINRPTQVKSINLVKDVTPKQVLSNNLRSIKLNGECFASKGGYHFGKTPLLFNNDLTIGVSHPQELERDFFKNAGHDELIFVRKGKGTMYSFFGNIAFEEGDYLIIPKGVIYQLDFKTKDNALLYVESKSKIRFPKRYLSKKGQFLEGAPLSERDFKLPIDLRAIDEKGDFKVFINKENIIHELTYAAHPFDVVGWDGYCYPFAISIHDFEPITGKIHQPPPVHQLFEGNNFVVCSFCPRLYDYHPHAIPAPYHHSNLDSDEVLYYVEGQFMSRGDVKCGDFTIHPAGIPHGPHPGAIENSIGKYQTEELAVMIDPFNPLKLTQNAIDVEDKNYFKSWL